MRRPFTHLLFFCLSGMLTAAVAKWTEHRRALLVNASDDKEQCVIDSLHSAPGLSPGCARCWYAEGMCTLAKCALPCLAPASAVCLECSEDNCFPECVSCSGLQRWAFPP